MERHDTMNELGVHKQNRNVRKADKREDNILDTLPLFPRDKTSRLSRLKS